MNRTRHPSGLVVTESAGPDAGPAVIWIHGYSMDSSIWRPLWDLLPGFHHVGVDLPGHGRSDPPDPGLTLPRLAELVAEVGASYRASRVVGLSFGSCAALQWAVQAPGTVSHLAVGSPTIAGVPTEPDAAKRFKELMMLRRFTGPGEQLAGLWMTSPPDIFKGLEQHPRAWEHMRSVVIAHRWAELANGVMGRLTSHVHSDEDLRRITARTFAVVGDEDMPTFLDNAKRLHDVVPGCALTTVTAAGHLVLIERPRDVAPALAAFLA
jgi:2-succinyl-6-hydroxy-2,4-cyclohexadiene-1-carboxylate synthase